ncbi:hypothetical protein FRX31_032748 [Thalictrum thalictroides]|uniref:RNase H type-1 domain-containing protein n=1 Tax=Thalictrum thalictroides TaxID=46969 RepID=A0A7J6V069_THATH|nr:hypothetical protein FRX31_032748 [Thalictrum thalictroides]
MCLPVGEVLLKCKFQGDTSCSWCQKELESHLHCFFLCDWARRTWLQSPLNIYVHARQNWDMMDWLKTFIQWCEEDITQGEFHLSYAVFLLYEIWRMRNHVRFERMASSPETLCEQVNLKDNRLWAQWHRELINTVSESTHTRECLNVSNYSDCGLVFTDAAYNRYSNNYSAAAVYKSSDGDIQAMAYRRGRTTSANHAEMMAIEVGLLLAKKEGVRKLIIKGDCMAVLQGLKTKRLDQLDEDASATFSRISMLCNVFSYLDYIWINRSENVEAHEVAKWVQSSLAMGPYPDIILRSVKPICVL